MGRSGFLILVTVALFGCGKKDTNSTEPKQEDFEIVSDLEEYAEFPSRTGVALGTGWNTFSGSKTTGTCVNFDQASIKGRRGGVTYSEVTDTSSLMSALSLSTEAKVKSILGGSADASAKFSRTVRVDTTGINIAADVHYSELTEFVVPVGEKARVLDAYNSQAAAELPSAVASTGIRSVSLKEEAAELLRNNPGEFLRRCGNAFVSSIRRGNALTGMYTFKKRIDEIRSSWSSHGSVDFPALSASDAGSGELNRLASEGSLLVQYTQLGSSGTPTAITHQQFQDLVRNMGRMTASTATPFELGYIRYSQIIGNSRSRTAAILDQLVSQYYRLRTLFEAIDSMLTNDGENEFLFDRGVSLAEVQGVQDRIRQDMRVLKSAITACVKRATDCRFPTGIQPNDYAYRQRLPVRKESVPAYVALKKAEELVAQRQEEYDRTGSTIRRCHGDLECSVTPHPHDVPNPAKAMARRELQAAQEQVETLRGQQGSVRERYYTWIFVPSRIRCKSNEEDMCLSNQQLQAIRQKMEVRAAANAA